MSNDLLVIDNGKTNGLTEAQLTNGIRRLGQRFIIELLTLHGSMQYSPERGCNFLARVRIARSELDVVVAFAAAKYQLRRNLIVSSIHLPGSERYADSRLEQVIVTDDALYVEFTVQSKANTTIRVRTPAIPLEINNGAGFNYTTPG